MPRLVPARYHTTLRVEMRKATVATMGWAAQHLLAGWRMELHFSSKRQAATAISGWRAPGFATTRRGQVVTIAAKGQRR